MSNATFAKSVDSFVNAEKKGMGAFNTLVEYSHNVVCAATNPSDALKSAIKDDETTYRAEHSALESMPAAYRSAKSVILSAVKAGVSLIRADGTYKGKSELEKECAASKSEKTAVEKFVIAINTATSVFADVDTLEDTLKCKAVLTLLADMVVRAEAALK